MHARDLLSDGPDGYVALRAAAVTAVRAGGDKELAGELKALTKPTAALWAVLAAGDDDALVRDAVAATGELAAVQAGGADRSALSAATARRRDLVERLIGRAVDEAKRWGDVPGGRRDEIRAIVDRLTRSPEATDAWIDATLRTLPDDAGGFSAFEGLTLAAPPPRDRPAPVRRSVAAPRPAAPPEPESAPPRPDPAEVRRADRLVAAAERDVARATEASERAEAAARTAADEATAARTTLAAAVAELTARRSARVALDHPR